MKNKLNIFGLLVFPLLVSQIGCSKGKGGGKATLPPSTPAAQVVPSGIAAIMSAKPPYPGIQTANDLYHSLSVATGLDPKKDGAISTRYSTVLTDLSPNGGQSISGPGKKGEMDLAAQFAVSLVAADQSKPLSDPTRIIPIDLTTSFITGGANTFSASIQQGLVLALVTNLTGLAPTDLEKAALLDTTKALLPLMPNTPAGKQLLVAMLMTIILSTNSWRS